MINENIYDKIDIIRKIPRRKKTTEDFETVTEVFDKRTLHVLTKMISDKFIDEVEFSISTGKEANVYRARKNDRFYALKIYRKNTATFRNLSKYILGDHRFKNIKKENIVYQWAKKEFKNLKYLISIGLPVPEPILCKENVLMMEYIGDENTPAPMLKDVSDKMTKKKLREILKTVMRFMQHAYKNRFVHGDLSAYNILINPVGKTVIIDVAQGVMLYHPLSKELLNRDVKNIVNYFTRLGFSLDTDKILNQIVGDGDGNI